MDLWTRAVRLMADDVLVLAQHMLRTTSTFFVARTDEEWFEVHQVIGNAFGCRILPNTKLPVDESYCGILFRTNENVLQIDDARRDSRVSRKQITKTADIGSYLGIRIALSSGETYGTLCALDPNPMKFQSEDVEALKSLARILARTLDTEVLAYKDSLSGLYNRTYLNILAKEQRDTDVTVHVFDINRFKLVNDVCGHGEGDRLIEFMGQALREGYPNAHSIRLGGDEFCVISEPMSEDEAQSKYDDISRSLFEFNHLEITASYGRANGTFGDISSLLSRADAAMYQGKRERYGLA